MSPSRTKESAEMISNLMLGGQIVLLLILLSAAGVTGCAPSPQTYPVKGRVVYGDGSPVTSGIVEFKLVSAKAPHAANAANPRGYIQEDGSFVLSSYPHDGAVAGHYQAIVQDPPLIADEGSGEKVPKQQIATKFRSYSNSGLEFDVNEKDNEIIIQVTKPKHARAGG